jgi:hypothetical protein
MVLKSTISFIFFIALLMEFLNFIGGVNISEMGNGISSVKAHE